MHPRKVGLCFCHVQFSGLRPSAYDFGPAPFHQSPYGMEPFHFLKLAYKHPILQKGKRLRLSCRNKSLPQKIASAQLQVGERLYSPPGPDNDNRYDVFVSLKFNKLVDGYKPAYHTVPHPIQDFSVLCDQIFS